MSSASSQRRAREPALALGPDPPERGAEPPGPVHPVRVRAGHLGADDAGGVGVGPGAADLHDLRVLHGDGQAAGVGAVQRTDARVLGGRHGPVS